jgi:transposase
MLQSSISNLETKNFKKSKLRYIKKTKKSKIFKVEYNSIRDFSFCTSVLGKKIKTIPEVNFKKVNSRITTIQYINGKFYMLANLKIKIEKHPIKEQKVISLDPGHRTFLTGLSNDHLIEIGNGIDKKIKKKLLKMDKIKEKRNKHPKYKRRKKRKYLLRHEKKITNYINNLHWQSINYLTANYNHILLGNYSTSLYYIKSLFSKRGVDKFINTFIFIFYYVFFCFLLSTLV